MKISRASLGRLTLLSQGAFRRIYRVDDFTLPDDTTPLIYEEFTSNRAEQACSARATVEFRASLSYISFPKISFVGNVTHILAK